MSSNRKDTPRVHIGISGWRYKGWRGPFYPKGLRQRDELRFAAARFDSIELNGSFYSLQRPSSYLAWANDVPDDFVFAVKGSRFITHMKRLRDVDVPLANFLASGVLALGSKLGPLLWQLPPTAPFDRAQLEPFLRLLPRSTTAAAKLARSHDARLEGRAFTKACSKIKLRHALEVRHPSYTSREFADLARDYDVAIVVADTAGKFPVIETQTSDFTYIRLHGEEELYVSGYDDDALSRWAHKVSKWRQRGDVFVYFDNDAKVRAPADAMALRRLLDEER